MNANTTAVSSQTQAHQNPQHVQNAERLAEFMSAEGHWTGGFDHCSKKVQGTIVYQIAQKAWTRGDFPGVDFTVVNFKDQVAKTYMEWKFPLSEPPR